MKNTNNGVVIGRWIEKETGKEKLVVESHIDGDWIEHRIKAGKYNLNLFIDWTRFLLPKMDYIKVNLDSEIIDGFGSSTRESRIGPSTFSFTFSPYKIRELHEHGFIELNPKWSFLNLSKDKIHQFLDLFGLPITEED